MQKTLEEAIGLYLTYLEKKGDKPNSIRPFKRALNRLVDCFGSGKIVSEVTDTEIQAYLTSDFIMKTKKGNPAAKETIGRDRRLIKRAVVYFGEQGWREVPAKSRKTRKAPASKKTSIVKASPSPTVPSDMDRVLDDAAAYINEQFNRVADSMMAIGRYLLKTFFDDDPDKVKDKSSRKSVSLRQLSQHPDMTMSFSALRRAVDLAIHERTCFTDSTLNQLSSSHKILLLRIENQDPRLIKKYGKQAVKEGLSVRKLEELLIKDGHLLPRGAGAIDGEQRKLIKFGLSKIVSPLDDFLETNLDTFDEKSSDSDDTSKEAVEITIDKMIKAKAKLDEYIGHLKNRL